MINDDDEAFDEHGILKDGRTTKVRMLMRDSKDAWRDTMHDYFTHNGLALHRPGFRRVTDMAALDAVTQAYADYDAADSARWQTCGDATREFRGQQPGDQCTINGAPGRLNAKLECVPDHQDGITMDAREIAYREYDEDAANAWRTR